MFGLGFGHLLLLAAIGLIVLGPEQLTQVARVLGKTIGEVKKAMHDVASQVSFDLDEEDRQRHFAKQRLDPDGPQPYDKPSLPLRSVTPTEPSQTAGDVPAAEPSRATADIQNYRPAIPQAANIQNYPPPLPRDLDKPKKDES